MGRICGFGAAMMCMGLGVAQPSSAQSSVLSAAGFTGYSVTPNARILPWGSAAFSYDNQVVGGPTVDGRYSSYNGSGHNFVGGFGILPNLEISGRIASSTIQSNCYSEGCGIRDLSFNIKTGFSFDEKKEWNLSIGATDFGGSVNFFRTVYGVVGYNVKNLDFNLGYAIRSQGLVGGAKPIDGIFGSAAYQPFSWLQGYVEYNDSRAWVGTRIFTPAEWLPSGWTAHFSINSRIIGEERASRNWMSVGISIPLYKVPVARPIDDSTRFVDFTRSNDAVTDVVTYIDYARSKNVTTQFTSEGLLTSTPQVLGQDHTDADPVTSAVVTKFSANIPVADEKLYEIAEELRIKGFEDISVGRLPSGAIAVSVNNATYNVNTVDGLGVALGVIARQLGISKVGYRLLLTQRQIAVVGVSGYADCLADWIEMKPARCVAGNLYTPGTADVSGSMDGAVWIVNGKAPSWSTARLILQPVLNSGVATEYGVFDYSAGVRATVQQPLWRGAYFEVGHIFPVSESEDYRPGRVFGNGRLVNVTDRVMLHQVIRLPIEKIFGEKNAASAALWGANAVTAHFATGRINSSYRGNFGELRWEPSEGRHRFGIEGGRFERTTYYDFSLPTQSRSLLASYRYSLQQTKTSFELTAGQFLYNDRGAQFLVTQWFDDISLSLYIRRTKYEFERVSRTFAGIEISLPLTPRKDMTPVNHIQITGAPQWSYGVETRIGSANFVSNNQGVFPGVAILDQSFNYDRAGMEYIEDNVSRIRSAAAK